VAAKAPFQNRQQLMTPWCPVEWPLQKTLSGIPEIWSLAATDAQVASE
jgi:hypothetical protein